jgi:soluble lytic murein transglycosylase
LVNARRLAIAFFVVLICVARTGEVSADVLSAADAKRAAAAFRAADAGQWKLAHGLAARVGEPLVPSILRWIELTKDGSDARLAEISAFLAKHPEWPLRELLLDRAEKAMTDEAPDVDVPAWFDEREPRTANGMIRLGVALMADGDEDSGRKLLRQAWIAGDFSRHDENAVYRRYRKLLTHADHVQRLDRLLWEGRFSPARRALWRVNEEHRALGEARLLLATMSGNVDSAIARVPDELKDHPGLVYERLRWRLRKGRYDSARTLLDHPNHDEGRPDKWWTQRAALARAALREGHVSEAYRIAAGHKLDADDGAALAEAEWLAGWTALRFLGEPAPAMGHFITMYGSVRYPISLARASYWAGRSAAALNDRKLAELWYRAATQHPGTYYGQLAAAEMAETLAANLPSGAVPSPQESAAFEDHELVRVIRILGAAEAEEHMRAFFLRLGDISDSPGWQTLTALLAVSWDRPDLAIAVAKQAHRDVRHLVLEGYPLIDVPRRRSPVRDAVPEEALVLAMVRQESAFDTGARSSAGARGLMQLLPATAKWTARELKLGYSYDRLNSDPEYNLLLGQTYMQDLLDEFDGSYVLALVAYNAGPARARRWVRDNGDLRDEQVDAVDWIELIPFAETRNFIQRAMENLQVYRVRLNGDRIAFSTHVEFKR